MKLSLVVAVVVLALAQGSFAQDAATVETIREYINNMKAQFVSRLSEAMNNPELASQAQSLQAQLEPMATNLQEQLKTMATNVEGQMKPVYESFRRQMEAIIKRVSQDTGSN